MYDCNIIYSLKNTFYENQNSYIPPSFEDFHTVVQSVVTDYINQMTEMEKVEMQKIFKNWKSEPDKLNVNSMYNSFKWRAIYTRELFWSRMQTVDCCIRNMLKINSVNSALKMVTTITSIGCGPGPDIASIISVLRSLDLRHRISVFGVDQIDGWYPYIDIMNCVDKFTTITFGTMKIDDNSVKCLDSGDMCIMSYTDASIHTSKFWEQLKQKFNLILILDQNKQELFLELKRQNFEAVNYNLKGNKRFFYFMHSELHRNYINRLMQKKGEISNKESRNISVNCLSNLFKQFDGIKEAESVNNNLDFNLLKSKNGTQKPYCSISKKKTSNNKVKKGKNKFFDKKLNNLDNYRVGDQKKKIKNNSFNKENILNNEFQTAYEVIEIDCNTTDDENCGAEDTYKISFKTVDKSKPKNEDLVNNFAVKKSLPLTNVSNKSTRKSRNRKRTKLTKHCKNLCKSNQMSKICSKKPSALKRLGKMNDGYHISSSDNQFSANYVYKSTALFDNSNYSINNQQTKHQIIQPAPAMKHFNFDYKNSYFNSSLNSSNFPRDTFETSLFSGYSNDIFISEHEYSNNYKNNSSVNAGLNFTIDRQSPSKLNSSRIFYNNASANFASDFKINGESHEPRFYTDNNGIWSNRKRQFPSSTQNYSEEPAASALRRTYFSNDFTGFKSFQV